jgi:hypothetical protein
MSTIRSDMEGAFNSFIEDQKKQTADEITVSLYQFDTKYEVVYQGRKIQDVPKLDLIPGGMTALYDGIGRTIDETGRRLAALPESERPSKIVILIITDGGENSSVEYKDSKRIQEMINHQRDKYNWTFMFLGANQDALNTARSFGIGANNAMTYASNSRGVTSSMGALSKKLTSYRGTAGGQSASVQCMSFNDDDYAEQTRAGVNPAHNSAGVTNTDPLEQKSIVGSLVSNGPVKRSAMLMRFLEEQKESSLPKAKL